MSIKKMDIIVKFTIPVILVIMAVLFVILNILMSRVTEKREEGVELAYLGNEMLHNNDYLVKLMREFIITYDAATLRNYENLINDPETLDNKLDRMKEIGLSAAELGYMDKITTLLDDLAAIEDRALAAYNSGNREQATAIIQSRDYYNADSDLAQNTKAMISEIRDRINTESLTLTSQGKAGLIVMGVFFVISLLSILLMTNWFSKKVHWHENILDNIPFPLSITDKDMKWTFINRPTENFLGKKRAEVMGQHCSNWGAAICNTNNCGVRCLGRGENSTTFNQMNMDFKVDVAYLTDKNGNNSGHIEIVQDITTMVQSQKKETALVNEIESISGSFVSASKQIADGAQALAQGSTQQAATVEQLSSSVSEITEKTKSNAQTAEKAALLANTIRNNAEEGNRHMDEMMSAVKDINDASQQIGKVIKTIDDIAFQTNILALNAAVEAARAGSAGKGFAVVAEEVRNLASKSAEAAKDTAGLIENSMSKAELGTRIAGETAESLNEIVSGITESSQLIQEIAGMSKEQTVGIDQINIGIDQVSQVVQQNSATAEESAASAEEMSARANSLETLIYNFHKG
ncbi:MAG: methyl-accepting chemotaxis protein [Oscillospiraceae bacterium]|nr:methyl-accepting chemotaxis protein [Oscillospiraceae bacterium]